MSASSPIGGSQSSYIDQTNNSSSTSTASEQGKMGDLPVVKVSTSSSSKPTKAITFQENDSSSSDKPRSILVVKKPTSEQSLYFKTELQSLAQKNSEKVTALLTASTSGTLEDSSLLELYSKNSELLSKFAANVKDLDRPSQRVLASLSSRNSEAYNEFLYTKLSGDKAGPSLMETMGVRIPTGNRNASAAAFNHTENCSALVRDIAHFVTNYTPAVPTTDSDHANISPAITAKPSKSISQKDFFQPEKEAPLSTIKKSPTSRNLATLGEVEDAPRESTPNLHPQATTITPFSQHSSDRV